MPHDYLKFAIMDYEPVQRLGTLLVNCLPVLIAFDQIKSLSDFNLLRVFVLILGLDNSFHLLVSKFVGLEKGHLLEELYLLVQISQLYFLQKAFVILLPEGGEG